MKKTRHYFVDRIIKGDFTIKRRCGSTVVIEAQKHLFTFQFRDTRLRQYVTEYFENCMFLRTNKDEKQADDVHNAIVRKIGNNEII